MRGPTLTLSDVKKASEKFLADYHPKMTIPIPIEEIAEIKMGISIVPVPGIKNLLGVDAFITTDFSEIVVDELVFNTYISRARFSIAHELGHLVLHKSWYEKQGPKNMQDYHDFYDRIDRRVYKYIEIQAQTFAGFVLVPSQPLMENIKSKIGSVPSGEDPEVLAPFIQDLPETFSVSGEVILRRLQREGVIKISR